MTINEKNLSIFKAELIQRIISTEQKESITGWYDAALDGVLLAQLRGFRNIELVFYLNAESEDEAYKLTSQLVEEIKVSTIIFDDIDLSFVCYLDGSTAPERVDNGKFKITVNLKNSLAKGQSKTVSFDITTVTARKLTVNYYNNWKTTVSYYCNAFDDSDLVELVKSEVIYVSTEQPTATSYNEYFGGLGVDFDKYHADYMQPGRINLEGDYDSTVAANLTSIDIYYDRIQTDGYDDIPSGKYYPSSAFSFNSSNTKYFEIPITTDTLVDDISVEVIGRWFDQSENNQLFAIDTSSESTDNYGYQLSNGKLTVGETVLGSGNNFTVYENSSTTGHDILIVTYEDISAVPMRKHSILSSNRGSSKQSGYYSVVFNGSTQGRLAIPAGISGHKVDKIKVGIAKNFDFARCRVYVGDELVADMIPISSSVKNCFVNNFDDGLYDVNTFAFVPWTDGSTTGKAPATPMVKPGSSVGPAPAPVYPTDPSVLWLYSSLDDVNNDDGTGNLAKCKASSADDYVYADQTWIPSYAGEDLMYIVCPVPNQEYYGWKTSNTKIAQYQSSGVDEHGRPYAVYKTNSAKGYVTITMTSDADATKIGSSYFRVAAI